MARKYTRDNRGRFASSGSGATARGGRLRTASGNKRKTQTMKAAGAGGAGVMKGKVARDPGAMAKAAPKAAPKAKVAKAPKPLEKAQERLSKARIKLENKSASLADKTKQIEKMRKKGVAPEDRKALSKSINKERKSVGKLTNAVGDYKRSIDEMQQAKRMAVGARTFKKAPATEKTRRNSFRVQQRKVTYITKTRGFEAAKPERVKLRQMLGKPMAKLSLPGLGIAKHVDNVPISRGRMARLRGK